MNTQTLIEATQARINRLIANRPDHSREAEDVRQEIIQLKGAITRMKKGRVPRSGVITVVLATLPTEDQFEAFMLRMFVGFNVMALQEATVLRANYWDMRDPRTRARDTIEQLFAEAA